MPYKKKEDRTEAVRRHRERKKEMMTIDDDETFGLGEMLLKLDFVAMPFEEWHEIVRTIKKDKDGIWRDSSRGGKIVYPPSQVFFGRNTAVVIWGGLRDY